MDKERIRKFRFNGEEVMTLPARREAFTMLKEWLGAIAADLELPTKTERQLLIAADEIFTNIASYGYPSGSGTAQVEVEFDMSTAVLTLVFADSGVAYNPLETPPPELDKPLAERKIGGLGIFMVQKIMDEVKYRRENGFNILVMTKKVLPAAR